MVRHIVMWNYKEGLTAEENRRNAQKIKEELEGLVPVIPGVISLRVLTERLPSGGRDLLLDSLFESEEALQSYQVHPEHIRVSGFIGSVTQDRFCVDFRDE